MSSGLLELLLQKIRPGVLAGAPKAPHTLSENYPLRRLNAGNPEKPFPDFVALSITEHLGNMAPATIESASPIGIANVSQIVGVHCLRPTANVGNVAAKPTVCAHDSEDI